MMLHMKDKLVRFGVSLAGELLRRFDAFIGAEGYSNSTFSSKAAQWPAPSPWFKTAASGT